LPPLFAPRIESAIPGFDAPAGGTAVSGLLDYMLLFALELLVLGAFLIVASFRPAWHEPLVWLVVALGVVRGVVDDVYMIAAGYPPAMFVGFIALHLAIIVSGLLLLRSAKRSDVMAYA
jgi:hypothetical protein